MEQEKPDVPPQRGTLLRRAHELLETLGQPASEEALIQHLFGASGNTALWTAHLRKALRSSSLFESSGSPGAGRSLLWSLCSWRTTQQLLDETDFVVVDTETTGLRPGPDRVIEVAALRLRGGKVIDTFQSIINPGRYLPPFIVKFTGITQEMVEEAPTAKEVLPDFFQFIDDATLVGHNLAFDLNFLTYEARLLRQHCPLDGLDTILLARRFLSGLKRFKLDMVAAHLKIPATNRHRALGDVEVTAAVFLRILELAQQRQGIQTLGHLRLRMQLPVAWSGDVTQVAAAEKEKLWSADAKLAPAAAIVTSRPNGSLFLDPTRKREFPTQPGVYLMKDANQQVIYVGKAKCLKDRLSSYYSQPLGYSRKMDGLLQNIKDIETIVLGSELEALLLESRLIKELQPPYNVQLRNYELYPFIKIDVQHAFPRVYAAREVAADGARYFGPFRSRHLVDLTIELMQKIFPLRTCTRSLPPQAKPSEPCLRLHLNRCSGPCRGSVAADAVAYHKVIEEVCAFLGGEREDLVERLRRQMFEASQQLNFERAAWLRDALRSVDELLIGQRLITGAIEANNLFIVYPSARAGHNEIFFVRHGRLVGQECTPHEPQAMRSRVHALLEQAALLGEPPSIVGKAEVDQINIISRWLHRHSDDRAFFPFQHALANSDEAERLVQRVWDEVGAVRALPIAIDVEEDVSETE
jgi:DNA polymerase III subunit epsilon